VSWLQSTPSNFTPLDIGEIESAQTPEEVHAKTRELLSEAAGIVQASSSIPEAKDKFVWDYNQATESYSQSYTSQRWDTLSELNNLRASTIPESISIDPLIEKQEHLNFLTESIQDGLKNGNKEKWIINMVPESQKFIGTFWEEENFSWILQFFDNNPELVEKIVLEDIDLFAYCPMIPEAVEKAELLWKVLREKYVESKNIQVSENLANYFLNQQIDKEKRTIFDKTIKELQTNWTFETLSQDLKSGQCSVDYIETLKEFNEEHFWALWIELNFTSEDAQSIIGSVIAAKKAEVFVETLSINEEIIALTWITREQLQDAIESQDPAVSIWMLLAPYHTKHPKLEELEGRLFEQLDIKREIEQQEQRSDVIIRYAPEIYDMNDEERDEIKQVLMSSKPEEVDNIIAEKIDEISQRPENIPYIPIRPEEQEQYKEVIAEIGFTPNEVSTLTPGELEAISTNEVFKENFVNMKTTLDDNNLWQLFLFRHQIFRSIWSLDFNVMDWNYVWENELNIFLSKIVFATTWEEKLRKTPSNLDTSLKIIRKLNHVDWFSWAQDVSSVGLGWSYIETIFREKFAPKDAGLFWFKTWSFRKALSI